MSIILVAVGDCKAYKEKFKKLDGDGFELKHSKTGEVAKRDIVQYVAFREFKNNFKLLARELLGEIAV